MSTKVFLDPERINELEPSEGDEASKTMLSPFAVPQWIWIDLSESKSFTLIRFLYSGATEVTGTPELLDSRHDPEVKVRTSLPSQKVLELVFDPLVKVSDLQRIAERLEEHARQTQAKAKRLSFRMTASILREVLPGLPGLAD